MKFDPYWLGIKLKHARTGKGLTQTQLGALVGCHQSAINHYETGKANPPAQRLCQIADILGVDVNYFFEVKNEPAEQFAGENGEEYSDEDE